VVVAQWAAEVGVAAGWAAEVGVAAQLAVVEPGFRWGWVQGLGFQLVPVLALVSVVLGLGSGGLRQARGGKLAR
jgi:hypothetical protein